MFRHPTAAALLSCAIAAASPAAAAGTGLYRAGLETPLTSVAIVRDIRWACTGASCSAPRAATSPDANVCTAIARRVGRLTSFSAGERSFDSAELARCNAAAPATATAVAAN